MKILQPLAAHSCGKLHGPGGVVISTDKAPRERRVGHACKIAKWMTGGIFTF